MLGGSVLVEYLFNIPGTWPVSFVSIEQKDFPTLMALTYIDAIVVLLSILLSDMLYVLADPRISFASQGATGMRSGEAFLDIVWRQFRAIARPIGRCGCWRRCFCWPSSRR